MPQRKFEPEKLDNDTFATQGLSEKKFNQVFNVIRKAQNKARRDAKRTLNRGTFTKPTNKALKALGEKVKGTGIGFTEDDLKQFDKERKKHQKKYDRTTAGITYAQIIGFSRDIDIKRANNQVDDGRGITMASFSAMKRNVAIVRVKASSVSKHEEHRVEIRFEEWDDYLQDPPGDDYVKAMKAVTKGRISFDCSCGRHQYWYRYQATIGNYAVTPPAEFSFPKIRNRELKGIACKHVLLAVEKCQSIAWHRIMAKRMEQQAKLVGFGDDKRQTTSYLTDKEARAAKKNKRNKIDIEKAKKAQRSYERSQKAMAKKLKGMNLDRDKIKKQSKTIRKQAKEMQQMANALKLTFNVFADSYKTLGKTRNDAIKDFAKSANVSVNKLKEIIK